MAQERFLDKSRQPDEESILGLLGSAKTLCLAMHEYVRQHYDFIPELNYFTKQVGWSVRYRKSNKTLCTFFPENGAFSALIVLGKKEAEQVEAQMERLNPSVQHAFESTPQLHDGKWVWMRITDERDLASFKLMLSCKAKPKESSAL